MSCIKWHGMQAEVDYGSPQQQDSDRGHVTIEAPTKDAGDLHDWEMLSRNPSPAPERYGSPSCHTPMMHVALCCWQLMADGVFSNRKYNSSGMVRLHLAPCRSDDMGHSDEGQEEDPRPSPSLESHAQVSPIAGLSLSDS